MAESDYGAFRFAVGIQKTQLPTVVTVALASLKRHLLLFGRNIDVLACEFAGRSKSPIPSSVYRPIDVPIM